MIFYQSFCGIYSNILIKIKTANLNGGSCLLSPINTICASGKERISAFNAASVSCDASSTTILLTEDASCFLIVSGLCLPF